MQLLQYDWLSYSIYYQPLGHLQNSIIFSFLQNYGGTFSYKWIIKRLGHSRFHDLKKPRKWWTKKKKKKKKNTKTT